MIIQKIPVHVDTLHVGFWKFIIQYWRTWYTKWSLLFWFDFVYLISAKAMSDFFCVGYKTSYHYRVFLLKWSCSRLGQSRQRIVTALEHYFVLRLKNYWQQGFFIAQLPATELFTGFKNHRLPAEKENPALRED